MVKNKGYVKLYILIYFSRLKIFNLKLNYIRISTKRLCNLPSKMEDYYNEEVPDRDIVRISDIATITKAI